MLSRECFYMLFVALFCLNLKAGDQKQTRLKRTRGYADIARYLQELATEKENAGDFSNSSQDDQEKADCYLAPLWTNNPPVDSFYYQDSLPTSSSDGDDCQSTVSTNAVVGSPAMRFNAHQGERYLAPLGTYNPPLNSSNNLDSLMSSFSDDDDCQSAGSNDLGGGSVRSSTMNLAQFHENTPKAKGVSGQPVSFFVNLKELLENAETSSSSSFDSLSSDGLSSKSNGFRSRSIRKSNTDPALDEWHKNLKGRLQPIPGSSKDSAVGRLTRAETQSLGRQVDSKKSKAKNAISVARFLKKLRSSRGKSSQDISGSSAEHARSSTNVDAPNPLSFNDYATNGASSHTDTR